MSPATPEEQRVLSAVLAAIREVRYGYVQLILQDGKVVQIDGLERARLRADQPPDPPPAPVHQPNSRAKG